MELRDPRVAAALHLKRKASQLDSKYRSFSGLSPGVSKEDTAPESKRPGQADWLNVEVAAMASYPAKRRGTSQWFWV